jgi:phage terminase large subunit-like protein
MLPVSSGDLYGQLAESLERSAAHNWRERARTSQLPPADFSIWALLSGRGFGKSWTGANLTCELAGSGEAKRIALVGPTWDHVRATMVEGASGILTVAPAWGRPIFEASKSQLTWPSGSIATMYSADQPESLRGPEHDFCWADELASWRRPDTWDNLLLTLRLGKPRVVVTTTPKPTRLIRDLVAREGTDGIVITRGSTYENRAHLAPQFFTQLVRRYEGTRLARQELLGQVLDDVPGALWNREGLEATRVEEAPLLQRVVIGVDPAGSSAAGADMTGIVACGLGQDGHLYVLADSSVRGTPREWAAKAIGLYYSLKADKVVVERNFGGEMAAATLASVDPAVPVKEISSSRGKVLRAEPIASFWEQKRAHVVGAFPELEDQLCSFTSDWDRARDGSPDRCDAMVFAGSELMLARAVGGFFSQELLLVDGEPVPLSTRPDWVFAVAVPSAAQDAIGVLFLADAHNAGLPYSLVILDYQLQAVSAGIFERWLPSVFGRLEELERQCRPWRGAGPGEPNYALWMQEEGIGATVLTQCSERGLPAINIDEHAAFPATLPERISDASSWIHAGKVKIYCGAHKLLTAHQGITRNHFLAQFQAYRVGGEDEEASELLNALCLGVGIVNPVDAGRKRARA